MSLGGKSDAEQYATMLKQLEAMPDPPRDDIIRHRRTRDVVREAAQQGDPAAATWLAPDAPSQSGEVKVERKLASATSKADARPDPLIMRHHHAILPAPLTAAAERVLRGQLQCICNTVA